MSEYFSKLQEIKRARKELEEVGMLSEIRCSNFDDKSSWGEGPWQDEPDKAEWIDDRTQLPCLIVRGPSGALCGYVGVGAEHPYFEKHYDKIDNIEVHGGLTFSDHCQKDGKICHMVDEGQDDVVWWLGFDCSHGGDFMPSMSARYREMSLSKDPGIRALFSGTSIFSDGNYRDFSYVKWQVERLAMQLKNKAKKCRK